MLKIYNTLNNQKEEFQPIDANQVGIYVCGMTVYDLCHMGHARVMVMFDVITRHLRRNFPNVKYVRNITDIDDKIITRAIENNEDIYSLTNRFIDAMHEDEQSLGVLSPDIEPRATDSIDKMIDMIESLSKKGLAYQGTNGDVFYSVRKFKEYGKLSGKNLDDLVAGARVDVENHKKDPLDFVLWKKAKSGEPNWPSPWGNGRPGWHIECSAMSRDYLGKNFDIHGGGLDLKFPHHDNENAQSKCNHDGLFANFWLHTGSLTIEEEKMSKSLGNFVTIKDILKRYHPEVIRFFLYSTHYRNPLNFSFNGLDESKTTLDKFYDALRTVDLHDPKHVPLDEGVIEILEDDFNSPKLISFLLKILDKLNRSFLNIKHVSKSIANLLISSGSVIGLFQAKPDEYFKFTSSELLITEEEIENLITDRNLARNQKDFMKSDKIRDDLKAKGITLEDVGEKTTWKRVNLDE